MIEMMERFLILMMVTVGVSSESCIPGEMTVSRGGVVRRGDNVTLALCLDLGETCDK